jgi:hypothetical protein
MNISLYKAYATNRHLFTFNKEIGTMKFIKVITKHTRQDIDLIVGQMDSFSMKRLFELYNSFKNIEFTTGDGYVGMYAVISEHEIEHLFSEYVKWSISFSFEDITKSILFGNCPEIEGEQKVLDFTALMKDFVEENLDTNTVLDKISEIGFHSLTEQDKRILQAH